jgi:hypothetical protein
VTRAKSRASKKRKMKDARTPSIGYHSDSQRFGRDCVPARGRRGPTMGGSRPGLDGRQSLGRVSGKEDTVPGHWDVPKQLSSGI